MSVIPTYIDRNVVYLSGIHYERLLKIMRGLLRHNFGYDFLSFELCIKRRCTFIILGTSTTIMQLEVDAGEISLGSYSIKIPFIIYDINVTWLPNFVMIITTAIYSV